MKRLKEFFRLRKQNDYVKLVFVIILVGIYMMGSSIFRGINIYKEVNTPIEYILQPSLEKVTQSDLKSLCDVEHVKYAGVQKELTVQIDVINPIEMFPCYMVSEKYLHQVFHLKNKSGMRVFYLTKKLYNKVSKKVKGIENEKDMFQANYHIGEETGVAKFIKINNEMISGEEMAFCSGNSAELSSEISSIRVFAEKKELEGIVVEKIQNNGYRIENLNIVKENEYDRNVSFLHMKYQVIICILCFVVSFILIKLVRKTTDKL